MKLKILEEYKKFQQTWLAHPSNVILGYKEIILLCEEMGWTYLPNNIQLFGLNVISVNKLSMLVISL